MPSDARLAVQAFRLELNQVRLPMGLVVDEVRLEGAELVVVKDPLEVSAPAPGRLRVTVGEASLAAFLNAQAPGGLRDFRVRLEGGRVYVDAVKTLIIDVKVKAVGMLRLQDARQLHVDVVSVDVMGAGAKSLVQSQLDRLNPVLDAADLPVPCTLDEVTAEDGALVLRGTVRAPGLLAGAKG